MTTTTEKLAEALRKLLSASMVSMTDESLSSPETVAAWDDAHKALAAWEAERAAPAELMVQEALYETIIQWDEGGGKRSRRELARRIAALYATPAAPIPARELSAAGFRKAAEHAYTIGAFDYAKNPVGSRDWCLFFDGYSAAHGITGDSNVVP